MSADGGPGEEPTGFADKLATGIALLSAGSAGLMSCGCLIMLIPVLAVFVFLLVAVIVSALH